MGHPALGVVLAVALAGACVGQRARVMTAPDRTALAKALAAYDAGDGAAAKPNLERLAAIYPDSFAANEALGLLYLEAGDFVHATPLLEHAAAASPRDAAAQANLGTALFQTGRTAEAVKALRRAALLDGKNAATFSSLGHALFLDKQPVEAAKAFERAATLDPARTDDLYDGAVALFDAHKDADAGGLLQRIASAQRTAGVESLWGDVEERQGHAKEAVEHLQAAAKLNASEANTYALAIELLRHWSWEPAMQITQFGVRQFPQSERLRLADGIAQFGAGKYPDAAAIFGALLAGDPQNESYGSLLGRSCAAAGGAAAPACDSLITFAEHHLGNAQIDVSAAVSLLHQASADQNLNRAQRLLNAAIRSDPRLSDAYYQLGVIEQQRQQWKESAASLSKAVELRPTFAEAHYRLSRAFSHTGEPERARQEIALQQRYSQQEKDDSNAKLKEVTIFLIAPH